jgi:signal transduction histidine kinase
MTFESNSIILVYFVGTLGMILLALSIFFFFVTYQKKMLKKQLELNKVRADQQEIILQNTISAQEKERKRIARDLHDEVGAMLSVVKLNVGRIEKKSEEPTAKELATQTKTYIDEVITQVRRISRSLLPPSLEKLGLYFALEEMANWINKSEQLKIVCWKSGEQFRFDNKKELAVFRIVQELLNNAIKHAGASTIFIKARFSINNNLMISVTDNGKGFELKDKMNAGLGLKNIESRSQIMGAMFKIKSIAGKGTKAIIYLNTKD